MKTAAVALALLLTLTTLLADGSEWRTQAPGSPAHVSNSQELNTVLSSFERLAQLSDVDRRKDDNYHRELQDGLAYFTHKGFYGDTHYQDGLMGAANRWINALPEVSASPPLVLSSGPGQLPLVPTEMIVQRAEPERDPQQKEVLIFEDDEREDEERERRARERERRRRRREEIERRETERETERRRSESERAERRERDVRHEHKHHDRRRRCTRCLFGVIVLAPGNYTLAREYHFTNGFWLSLRGMGTPGGVVIRPQTSTHRHFSFSDNARLRANNLTLERGGMRDGGNLKGGSLHFVDARGRFQRVIFRLNNARVGGAVFADVDSRLRFLEGVIFEDNWARQAGGALAVVSSTHHRQNRRNKHDNARQARHSVLRQLREGEERRHANRHDFDGWVELRSTTFRRNSAVQGGAIFNDGRILASDNECDSNMAGENGGAVYNSGSYFVRQSRFEHNRAVVRGGAVFSRGQLRVVCCSFDDNRAHVGDDIFFEGRFACSATTAGVRVETDRRRQSEGDHNQYYPPSPAACDLCTSSGATVTTVPAQLTKVDVSKNSTVA